METEVAMLTRWPTLNEGWYMGSDDRVYYYRGNDLWICFGVNGGMGYMSIDPPSRYTRVTPIRKW